MTIHEEFERAWQKSVEQKEFMESLPERVAELENRIAKLEELYEKIVHLENQNVLDLMLKNLHDIKAGICSHEWHHVTLGDVVECRKCGQVKNENSNHQ